MAFAWALITPAPVFAGGTLRILCDPEKIDKSLKDYYPACGRGGSALPGDVVLLEGSGYTISTKQSPVVIDQATALVSGDRRISVPRIYPVPPTSSSYDTLNGEFRANIVVPVETPPGEYDISFKVTQRACNYSKGVPCIVDIASAHLTVLPTAGPQDIKVICDKGEGGTPSASTCQKGSPLSLAARPLPTRKSQPIYFYYKKSGQYTNTYEYLTAERDHSVQRLTLAPSEPGEYTVILRSILLGLKMGLTDFEKTGPTIKVVVPAPTQTKPIVSPPVEPPPAVREQPIVAGLSIGVSTDQDAYRIPALPMQNPYALVPNARFRANLIRYSGAAFREGHRMTLSLGTGTGPSFKKKIVLNDLVIGASVGGPAISKNSGSFAFGSVFPALIDGKLIPNGAYTLRAESMDNPALATYYVDDLQIAAEQLRPLKPKIKIPTAIRQGEPFVIQGSQFPRDAKIIEVRLSADAEPIVFSQDIAVKKDGTFAIIVKTPDHADAIIKYVVDENDKPVTDFFWNPSKMGRIFVSVQAKEKDGTAYAVTEKTMIPLLCPIAKKPSIVFTSPPLIDQSTPYSVSFDASGFICRDQLSIRFEGIKVRGKKIDPSQTKDFFAVMPSLSSDANGEARNLGFGSGWGTRQFIDSDVEKITMIVSDRHKRKARAEIRVIARYSIELKKKTDPGMGDAIIWKGFDVPGWQAAITLENEKLLGKEHPLLLKSPYLDRNDKDENGFPVIGFSVPSDIPSGSYTLRLQQGDNSATTEYIKESVGSPKRDETNIAPPDTSVSNPCAGLEGYMLRTCRAAYDLDVPKENVLPEPENGAQKNPCKDLEGYLLRQCEKAYGIQPPPPDVKNTIPDVGHACEGLEGYMLRQCKIAYGIQDPDTSDVPDADKKEIRYCDPVLPKIWQEGCVQKQGEQKKDEKPEQKPEQKQEPPQEKKQQAVIYCDPELPKIWQEGCVQKPREEKKEEEAPLCNPQVPLYSQPKCRQP